jgi:uncharacterized protein (TIGR01319 family)
MPRRTEAEAAAWLARIERAPDVLAATPAEKDLDRALASLAVDWAYVRHAGSVEQVYTPMGALYQQTGKDLTRVGTIVLTGGALVNAEDRRNSPARTLGDHPPR